MKYVLPTLIAVIFLFAGGIQTVDAQCFPRDPSRPAGPNNPLISPDGTPCVNTVLTAVPFLRIVADARSGAMGDVGIGLSPDPNAMHFNPSKLAFAEQKMGLSATYTPWLRALGLNDVYLAYLTGFYKIDDMQTLGFGLRYFSLGSIPFTDVNGEPLVTGRPNEFEVTGAYARKLADRLSASVSAKFIFSNLAAGQIVSGEVIEPGIAGAADFSLTYKAPIEMRTMTSDLTVGLAITNVGSKITYTKSLARDFLPANIGLGAAWTLDINDFNRITFASDVNKLLVPTPCQGQDCDLDGNGIPDFKEEPPIGAIFSSFGDAPEGFKEELRELTFSFGAEYWYDQQFAVRLGYYTEHFQKGGRKFLTAGLGLKYNVFGLNFSYLIPTTNQRNPLDNTLRFSLLFDFAAFDAEK
ncbi:MAG: type IX secretion system outer membrane channel protein PorV [Saprospiraceae bacterium]|nr:type IX secretion system outer membrane channel protein PorV [Saprospiraceae bacterium]